MVYFLLGLGVLSCKPSKFSGDGKKQPAVNATTPKPAPSPQPTPHNCNENPVMNESETYNFSTFEAVRNFVNSFCKADVPTTWASQGAMRNDDKTKEIICRLQGFQYVESFEQFSFKSPNDNGVAWWDEATQKFNVLAGAKPHNYLIKSLTCRGRLFDQCKQIPNIDCQRN